MNYTKDGKIKHIEYDDVVMHSNHYDDTGRATGMIEAEPDMGKIMDLFNFFIDEINELKNVKR